MFNNSNGPSLSDIAAVTGNNGGFGDGNGWWILVILLALFGWGNHGGGYGSINNSGVGFTLGVPATQADVFNQTLISKLDGNTYGIADSTYAINNALTNGFAQAEASRAALQTALMQNGFNIQSAINNCCCENKTASAQTRYDLATDTCAITTAISQAAQQIMQNDNANYRQLHDENVQAQLAAKDAQIADMNRRLDYMNLRASQSEQNHELVGQLRPSPIPAYYVPNPYAGYNYGGCPCNS